MCLPNVHLYGPPPGIRCSQIRAPENAAETNLVTWKVGVALQDVRAMGPAGIQPTRPDCTA